MHHSQISFAVSKTCTLGVSLLQNWATGIRGTLGLQRPLRGGECKGVWRKMDLFLHKTIKLCLKVKYHCGVWWLAAGSSSLLCAITRWCCYLLHLKKQIAFFKMIKLQSFSIVLFLSSFGLLFCRNVYIRYADSLVSHGCQLLHRFAIILSEELVFLRF